MDDKTLNFEKQHLSETIEKLRNARNTLSNMMDALGSENLGRLQEMRDNPDTSSSDFAMFVQQLHEKNETFNVKDKIKRQEEMEYLMREPYFARIDLSDPANSEESTKKLYIGKFGYTEDRPVITDWRAKVASIYYRYRYPQKHVVYRAPDGEIVQDLDLKRTFEIDEGELIKFFNNDIQLDESEIIADKIEERTGGVLEDIVETIQEGQLDIIESDPRKICIVQGCVGSGKSTVAIHKLSHIFFNYPEIIQPERAILVAKSGILVSYLATLFPKLGIFDINYKTLRELVYNLLFREELKLSYELNYDEDLHTFDLSSIDALRDRVRAVHEDVEERIQDIFEKDEFASLASYAHDSRLSIVENINDMIAELNEELEYQKDRLKDNPSSIKSWIFKENIQNLRKLTNRLQTVKKDLKEKELKKLCAELDINLSSTLNYKEVLIYLYIYSELFGFPNSMKYQYCVVDEGQDFSELEYLVLGKLVLNGRFCILGDLNQSYVKEGLTDWNSIKEVIEEANAAEEFQLDTNYRSTKQIIDFANEILSPYTKNYLPKSINRQGPEIVRINTSSIEESLEIFKNHLDIDLDNLDKSIGVVVFDDAMFDHIESIAAGLRVSKDLDPSKIIKLEEHTRISYIPKGVYLSKFETCKGLEFAKVYLLGLNLNKVSNFLEAKKAFVAVTRAMNELVVLEN